MSNPENLKYTATHEWVRLEADGTVSVGITHHAQEALGDMVFIEAPAIGRQVSAKEECAVLESVKAAADLYAPISGTVTAINQEVVDAPELINNEPFNSWIFQLKPDNTADIDALLDAAAYQTAVDQESH